MAACVGAKISPDCLPGKDSMKIKKHVEQWCCDTKRGKANDLLEAPVCPPQNL